ncbi:hypothetical protein NPIL_55801 [Nephila pilipes]|uniref:Uncharacterized protein n=1 Tax=Nephila pilipes TaxID=299642 RepID=A0A8X6NWN8_NEPPI|nr:hypothetical protein NPIL_55801 [Nephila pilipes]
MHVSANSSNDESIDEESVVLLDNEALMSLIPKAGTRLKFKKYLNSFTQTTNFFSVPISDSTGPLCNTDATFYNPVAVPTTSIDILTLLHHSLRNISDFDVSSVNTNGCNNQCNILLDLSLNDSESLFDYTPIPLSSPMSTSGQKEINIRKIIKLELLDIFTMLEMGDPYNINILQKYHVNRLLVKTYVENYSCKPTTKNKLDLAKYIVNTLPVLEGSDGEDFVKCFSANCCCRVCLVQKNAMQKIIKEDNNLLHHKAGHDAYVRDVFDENTSTVMCRVKSDCPYNE